MKKVLKNNLLNKNEILMDSALNDVSEIFIKTNSSENGLTNDQVLINRSKFGNNIIETKKKKSVFKRIIESYVNPFTAILFVLAIISLITDVIFVEPVEKAL